MEVLGGVGALMVMGAISYLIYHFIRKIKNKDRTLPKKKFYPVLIGGFSLIILGTALTDPQSLKALSEAREMNESLTVEVEKLEAEVKELEEINKAADKEKKEEIDELAKAHEGEVKSLKEDYQTKEKEFTEQITSLEEKKTSLEGEVTTLKEQAKAKQTEVASTSSSSSSSSNSTSSSSGAATNTSSSPSSSSNSSECNIKGSNSGIYHTPSSSYYNRTTNVAQWFCSVEEAQAAGYRAPKR